MATLDGHNLYLAKGMSKKYKRLVNPALKRSPGWVEDPTDLMILQHALRKFAGTPFTPVWVPRRNMLGIYGYLLVKIRR